MKALTTITDPVYIPKEKYTFYDKFWLRLLMTRETSLLFTY